MSNLHRGPVQYPQPHDQQRPEYQDTQARPISEEFRVIAHQWADAEAAANMLEESKTATLEQMKTRLILELGDMPDSHAERKVKATDAWRDYIAKMCEARAKANHLKIEVEYVRLRHSEWIGANADARTERRMY